MIVSRAVMAGGLVAAVLASGAAGAQQPPYVPKQSDRPAPVEGDEPGFTPIFDGKTLKDWEGDPTYWRVEGGSLVGEITPATIVKSNTFVIWRGGRPKDFELKLDYRITAVGNSGINYRSASVPDPVTPANRFALRGYQFDIDGPKRYIGQKYEEKGRLLKILNECIASSASNTVKIAIGSELGIPSMRDFTVVTSSYKATDSTVGFLGIIGPVRMEYDRVISTVGYLGRLFSQRINT